MNERPTLETDAFFYPLMQKAIAHDLSREAIAFEAFDFARLLERQRDEAREQAENFRKGCIIAVDQLAQVQGDLRQAREELDDWRNAAKGAENPHPDEVHCTCVPLLHKVLADERKKVAEMRAVIGQAAAKLGYIINEADALWDIRDEARAALAKLQPFLLDQ